MANVEHSGRPADAHRTAAALVTAAPVAGRLRAARLGLWALAALLAARQVTEALADAHLTAPGTWPGLHLVPRAGGSPYDPARFTGTPFAGLLLRPLAGAGQAVIGLAWTAGTLLLVAALGLTAVRALPRPVGRRTALLAAPAAISLLLVSAPVRDTLWPGRTAVLPGLLILPVLLVLLGCLTVRGERAGGLCVGAAAALQPALLLFVPLLWCTGRRRAALSAAASFAGCTALAWAAAPPGSAAHWPHLAGAGLGGGGGTGRFPLGALLPHAGLTGPPATGLFLALGAAVAVLGLRRAVRYARDGQFLLAVAVTGCAAVAVSPGAWRYQLLWLLLTVAGRVGRRAADRPVWPAAVIVVATLPAKMVLPGGAALDPVRANLPLLAALAAATAVPFLSRTSPHFRTPVPQEYAGPDPFRRVRHLPFLPTVALPRAVSAPLLRRVLTRPNLLLELLLIRVTYAAYSSVRAAAQGDRATAEAHGHQVHVVERALHIAVEHGVNHAVVALPRLEHFLTFYYETFHFVVPPILLAVLWARRPADYRWARAALGLATVLGLVGFWCYPLAPPRLMPGLGFVDTVHGVQDFSRPDYGVMTAVTNQYAAMPSLHFGWALWSAVVIVAVARGRWVRALGLVHPLCTVAAIVATANHWVLDAVGGAAVVGLGFALTSLLWGPRAAPPALTAAGHLPDARTPRTERSRLPR
ncbi:bifunctional glycosyltransferase 87/phosphatase PAP2 family protein [Streptomyces sp. NPDC005573]|uniref:bifunctional glycosyltransferase 87/phosphatase PAP2 family protein n=1 Tax=Streptomyces sp. NPDC005573 TaxID=3156890 RepID=UPI0033A15C5F